MIRFLLITAMSLMTFPAMRRKASLPNIMMTIM